VDVKTHVNICPPPLLLEMEKGKTVHAGNWKVHIKKTIEIETQRFK